MFIKFYHIVYGILAILVCVCYANAQNLVPNGDFEDSVACQTKFDSKVLIPHWEYRNTLDVYNEDCSARYRMDGSGLKAYSGKKYVGQYFSIDNGTYGEKMYCKLLKPLEKGCEYELAFYLSLGERSQLTIKKFVVMIAPSFSDQLQNEKYKVQLTTKHELRKKEWSHYRGTYIAQGGELYLVIDNFLGPRNHQIINDARTGKSLDGYLLIDNISMVKVDCADLIPIAVEAIKNDTIVMTDLNFKTGSWELTHSACEYLAGSLSAFKQCNECNILIIGYTDSIGADEDNIILSRKRALSVGAYLQEQGIDSARLSIIGMGPQYPIATNETEAGRMLNRRVEIIITSH